MMSLPVYPATYPMAGQSYGMPAAAPPRLAPPVPAPPAPANTASQPAAPRRVVRAQAADDRNEIKPAPPPPRHPPAVSIPTPEQLGVTAIKSFANQSVDWTALHNRLNQLGATCFRVERLSEGRYYLTCLLPTDQQGRSHRIDAQGTCEADAARLLLTKASEWAAER